MFRTLKKGFTLFEMGLVLLIMGVMAYVAIQQQAQEMDTKIAEAEGRQVEAIRIGAEAFLYDFYDVLTMFDDPAWLAAAQTDPTCLTTAPTCKFATGAAKLAYTGLVCNAGTNECNFPNTSAALNAVSELRRMGYLGSASLTPRYSGGAVADQYQMVFKRPGGPGTALQGVVYSTATWMKGSPTAGLVPDMVSIGKAVAVMGAGGGFMANAPINMPCKNPLVIYGRTDNATQCPIMGSMGSAAAQPYNFTPNIALANGARLIGLINNKSSNLSGLLRTDGSNKMQAALDMNGNSLTGIQDFTATGTITANTVTTDTMNTTNMAGLTNLSVSTITAGSANISNLSGVNNLDVGALKVDSMDYKFDPSVIPGTRCDGFIGLQKRGVGQNMYTCRADAYWEYNPNIQKGDICPIALAGQTVYIKSSAIAGRPIMCMRAPINYAGYTTGNCNGSGCTSYFLRPANDARYVDAITEFKHCGVVTVQASVYFGSNVSMLYSAYSVYEPDKNRWGWYSGQRALNAEWYVPPPDEYMYTYNQSNGTGACMADSHGGGPSGTAPIEGSY